MRLLLILLVIAVASLISPSIHAQTIRLKNGNSLHGEVEYPNEHQVVVDIPGVGKLTFHKDEIAAIEESSDQTSRQEIPPPQESGTPPSRETGNSQRQNQWGTYHYYPATEKGLTGAQRALERAIKAHAVSEIRQLKDTIQRIRISLTAQRESEKEQRERERKKEQLEAEQRSVEAKQAKRAKSGSPGIGESAGGKSTPIEQLPTYLDPLTGRTCGVSGCQ